MLYTDEEILGQFSTSDLIAELERRRPCERCIENRPESCCGKCVFYFGPIENNFKEKL